MITTNDGKTYTFTYDATGKKLIAKLNLAGAGQIVQDSIPGIDLPTPPPFIGPLIHGMGNTTNSIIENGGTLDPTLIPQQQNDPLVQKYGYCGNILYHNNDISKILNPEGYVTFDNSNNPVFHYFIKDHLGSVRVVFDGNNSIEQVNHYYAFGGLMGESTGGSTQWYKYNGKELDRMNGLDWYDYGARYYDAMRFTTMDPMTEKYYSVSPYAYCANNPINAIDPDGTHIDVKQNKDGTYTLIGGETDDDRNVYLTNGNERTIIGATLTNYSFFKDDGSPQIGAQIDLSDNTGQEFLNSVMAMPTNEILLLYYALNAWGGQKYDFKRKNAKDEEQKKDNLYHNRGMRVAVDGIEYIMSARDVGNFGAGYMAGQNGLPWKVARTAFDALQSIQDTKISTEGLPTVLAERAGFESGRRKLKNEFIQHTKRQKWASPYFQY